MVRILEAVERSDQSTQQKKTSSRAETREDVRERFAARVWATNRLHKLEKKLLAARSGNCGRGSSGCLLVKVE
jgi:hypothetical protein